MFIPLYNSTKFGKLRVQPKVADKKALIDVRQASSADMKEINKELDSWITANGIIEVLPDGYGFIRCENYMPGENDVYVAPSQIRRFNLKTGDEITGDCRPSQVEDKYSPLLYIKKINDSNYQIIGGYNCNDIPEKPHNTANTQVIEYVKEIPYSEILSDIALYIFFPSVSISSPIKLSIEKFPFSDSCKANKIPATINGLSTSFILP